MADIQKVSVALTGEQLAALKAAVEAGEYATTSEIVREALRDWQYKRDLRQEEVKRLRNFGTRARPAGRRSLSTSSARSPPRGRGLRKRRPGDARRPDRPRRSKIWKTSG